jgi:uroporphyrinogen decarboxylase
LLTAAATLPLEVLHVDFRTSLGRARAIVGDRVAVQGNLDPTRLVGGGAELESAVARVLADASDAPGHIFNLGDGIGPDADPDAVARLIEIVHARRLRSAPGAAA